MSKIILLFYIYLFLNIVEIIYCTAKTTKRSKDSKTDEQNLEPVPCYYRRFNKNEIGIHVWGVIGMDENTKEIVPGGVVQEVDKIFQHIKTILEKHGTSFKRVATFIFTVDDKAHHNVTEEALKKYVEPPLPGRQLRVSQDLPKNVHVDCEFVAFTAEKLDRSYTGPTP